MKQKRKKDIQKIEPAPPVVVVDEKSASSSGNWLEDLRSTDGAMLFNPSILKFVVLSLVTGGLYPFLWMYKNWCYIKQHRTSKVSPFLRTVFWPFWLTALFRDMFAVCGKTSLMTKFAASNLAFVCLFLGVSLVWPRPYNLLSRLVFVPMIALQFYVNKLNREKNLPVNSRFTVLNWVTIVVLGFVIFIGTLHAFGLRAHR